MYEMIEKANQELEVKYKSQRTYTSSYTFPYYESGIPRNRSQKDEWKDKKSQLLQQNPREQFDDKLIPRDSNSRNKESGIIGNERNGKKSQTVPLL